MPACTSKLCQFALVKFRNPKNVTCENPPGSDPLPQETQNQELNKAMEKSEKPNEHTVSEPKCDKGCYCRPMGVPRWDVGEDGKENWHDAHITFKVLLGKTEYTIKASAEALDGVQDGKCKPADTPNYELAMAGEIPGLGLSFTIQNPELLTDKVREKLGELATLG